MRGTLHLVEVSLSVFGVIGNLIFLICLSKTASTSTQCARKVLFINIAQCVLDLLACSAYLPSALDLSKDYPSTFVCRIINTRVPFWIFINYRGFLNTYNALWQHTRIVYPFWSTVLNSPTGCTFILTLSSLMNILQSYAFTRLGDFANEPIAHCLPNCIDCQSGDQAGLNSLAVLCSTVYRFVLPIMIMMVTFDHLTEILSDCEGTVYQHLCKQLRVSALLDVKLYAITLLTHELLFLMNAFVLVTEFTLDSFPYKLACLVSLCYPVLCPCLSIGLRSVNYMPGIEAVLRPTDYQKLGKLAMMWRTTRS
ncbi:uncharacterized protein DEA37_0012279 [Paragonimus westermani]|uniref:G-protein coupled receptors family 1 profile domain-containing protein n=1 Tax=Paragonimus westermani TaxID=34504 RepID=A0A5J4NYI8_9TREM|nr:uncharacterized protein DEA37_0012279 [Paragonimus westermani]